MVEGISSTGMGRMQAMQPPNYRMTDEQKTTFSEIISQYNTDDMSDSDMKSLLEEIKSAGIKPGEDLKSLMETSGLEVTKNSEGMKGGAKAGGNQGPPPPPKEMPEELTSFIEKYQNDDATEEDITNLIEWLESKGIGLSGNIVNEGI